MGRSDVPVPGGRQGDRRGPEGFGRQSEQPRPGPAILGSRRDSRQDRGRGHTSLRIEGDSVHRCVGGAGLRATYGKETMKETNPYIWRAMVAAVIAIILAIIGIILALIAIL